MNHQQNHNNQDHICIQQQQHQQQQQQQQHLNKNLQNDHINYNGNGGGGDGNNKEILSLGCCCNINVNDYVNNGNLFLFCCITACLSLIAYLIAFSCEVSWILEAKGNLPTISYLLCSGYFLMFISSTILIHGLATGLSWGLFSWSIVVGTLSIPELCFVMIMTTQYWGLQSTHGLTELIGYLIRLIVNCLALLCVIPTALKWKRQKLLLSQLEGLASRLQISTPLPQSLTSSPSQNIVATTNNTTNNIIINQNNMNKNDSLRRNINNSRRGSCFDNPAFINTENQLMHQPQQQPQQPQLLHHHQQKPFQSLSTSSQILYGVYPNVGFSPNEFNASIFGLDPSQYIGPPFQYNPSSKRTQSLLDLRYVLPNNQIITNMQQHQQQQRQQQQQQQQRQHQFDDDRTHGMVDVVDGGKSKIGHLQKKYNLEYTTDPIYQTISSEKSLKSLGRNCISLENLERIEMITTPNSNNNNNNTKNTKNNNTAIKNFNIKNNVLENYNALFMLQGYPIGYHQQFPIQYVNYLNNPQQYYNNNNMNMNMNNQQIQHSLSQQHLPSSSSSLLFNGYGGFGGYTNPNPYINRSNTNSKQSLGNESDDYRRYRDVAL